MKKKLLALILMLTMAFTVCVLTSCSKDAEEPVDTTEEYTVEEETATPDAGDAIMILVNKDSGIKSLDDLAGKMVGVQVDSAAFAILNEGDGAELANSFGALIVEETYAVCYDELRTGAIDAIAIDKTTGDALIAGDENYEYLSETIE